MEDIDKNGDGLIDLDEYIGEVLQTFFVWAPSVEIINIWHLSYCQTLKQQISLCVR